MIMSFTAGDLAFDQLVDRRAGNAVSRYIFDKVILCNIKAPTIFLILQQHDPFIWPRFKTHVVNLKDYTDLIYITYNNIMQVYMHYQSQGIFGFNAESDPLAFPIVEETSLEAKLLNHK